MSPVPNQTCCPRVAINGSDTAASSPATKPTVLIEYQSLQAERTTLLGFIAETPAEDVLDLSSLRHRLGQVEQRIPELSTDPSVQQWLAKF
jgi:hypothetical protein